MKVDSYELTFEGKKGDPETIRKRQVRAVWNAKKNVAVLSTHKKNPGLARAREPMAKPQYRYHCSNRRLFQHMEAEDRLAVDLLEGEIVIGTVNWIGRWEFGMKTRKGPIVTVFRHAMAGLEIA